MSHMPGEKSNEGDSGKLTPLTGPDIGGAKIPWPHAPLHQRAEAGTYFVTAGTYLKRHHFGGRQRLSGLHRDLLAITQQFDWQLEAWAVFSNHYHFVGHSPREGAQGLVQFS